MIFEYIFESFEIILFHTMIQPVSIMQTKCNLMNLIRHQVMSKYYLRRHYCFINLLK